MSMLDAERHAALMKRVNNDFQGEDPVGEDPVGEDPVGEDPVGAAEAETTETTGGVKDLDLLTKAHEDAKAEWAEERRRLEHAHNEQELHIRRLTRDALGDGDGDVLDRLIDDDVDDDTIGTLAKRLVKMEKHNEDERNQRILLSEANKALEQYGDIDANDLYQAIANNPGISTQAHARRLSERGATSRLKMRQQFAEEFGLKLDSAGKRLGDERPDSAPTAGGGGSGSGTGRTKTNKTKYSTIAEATKALHAHLKDRGNIFVP